MSLATSGSHMLRFQADFSWCGANAAAYKSAAAHWRDVTRTLLAGGASPTLPFELRYFEIAPGGYSSLERHAHEHVVVVLRGRGTVRLGESSEAISWGDVVCVAPWEVHQFRNDGESEPLGFLCIVAKDRDRPVVVEQGTMGCELPARDVEAGEATAESHAKGTK